MSSKFRSIKKIRLLCLAWFLFPLFTLPQLASAANETLYIKVRTTKLRAQPSHLAVGSTVLSYGDSVEKIQEEGGWLKVKAKSSSIGFLHPSAVTDRKVVLGSKGNMEIAANSSEVVMAGKGFSPAVEKAYAKKNPSLNFRAIDEMERSIISEKDLALFVRDGKLSQQG